MKNNLVFFLFFTTAICLFAGSSSAQTLVTDKKVLIVYLSHTNNTKAIAEIIHKEVGGTLVALKLTNPYPENYTETVPQVVKENEKGYLPPLKTMIDSIAQYNVVFVRFPTWWMKLPPPIKSLLHLYDLKKVVAKDNDTITLFYGRKKQRQIRYFSV
ncbi:hypothetical protein GVN20_27275 [Runella sp. CRIBMP]|uniref:flavodoxin n=1 Tax=Runella sp. CRIBMP TaxID=2683261 RepID=UPI00141249B6|nr:flavodoxin [Runella sp. CRIBMP]NBB23084.1 hypothetical protein [Runella sp. CRIBMP]